jgi:hypothetical protein
MCFGVCFYWPRGQWSLDTGVQVETAWTGWDAQVFSSPPSPTLISYVDVTSFTVSKASPPFRKWNTWRYCPGNLSYPSCQPLGPPRRLRGARGLCLAPTLWRGWWCGSGSTGGCSPVLERCSVEKGISSVLSTCQVSSRPPGLPRTDDCQHLGKLGTHTDARRVKMGIEGSLLWPLKLPSIKVEIPSYWIWLIHFL